MNLRPPAAVVIALAVLTVPACSSSSTPTTTGSSSAAATTTTGTSTTPATLPGAGKPQITIGDKNDTEQFLLGELYVEALKAQGYSPVLNPNIGPDQIRLQQLQSGGKNGGIDMYPEYLNVWNSEFAGDRRHFKTERSALKAGQDFAALHGLMLLSPTQFSDTAGIGVTVAYADANDLSTIPNLAKAAATLTLGGPPQFEQDQTNGLPAMESAYGFAPASYKVNALLTLPVMRELNALVDLSGETPAGVASRFLADHGLIPPSAVITS